MRFGWLAEQFDLMNSVPCIFSEKFKLENKSKLEKTVKNCKKKHAKWGVFYSKRTFYSFFLWISHFFDSFKNSFNSTAKIFIQRIYSFNSTEKYSFKECIHSKNNQIIHSMKIFIFLKSAVSATPILGWPVSPFGQVGSHQEQPPLGLSTPYFLDWPLQFGQLTWPEHNEFVLASDWQFFWQKFDPKSFRMR